MTLRFKLRTLLIVLALVSIGMGVFRGCSWFVSESERDKLAVGMTREQVQQILGPPHGRYDPGRTWLYQCDFPTYFSDPLVVGFDNDGHVDWISR